MLLPNLTKIIWSTYKKCQKVHLITLLQSNQACLASYVMQMLPPLSLPAREGWYIVDDARRAYAYSKVGTAACDRDGVAGLDLLVCFCSFIFFLTLTVLVVLLVVAWRTPTTWISSVMVTICCVFAALHWNSTRSCNVGCLRALKSGHSIRETVTIPPATA